MKKLILLFALLISGIALGQKTTTNAVYLGELTEVQRDALVIGATYFPIIYNSTSSQHEKWNGSSWEAFGSGAEVNDLSSVVTWANVPNANITEGSVTQHEAALSITESQISDLAHTAASTDDQTASEVSIADAGNIIAGVTVETALQENRTAIDLNTSKTTNATHTGDVTGATALTIATDAVDISMLSATGTADGTTYLRGDNTWATVAGGGGDDVSGFAEKTGALVGTDRLVGLSTATDFNETISGIPLSIFNDDLGHTENATHTGEVTGSTALTIAVNAVETSNILDGTITIDDIGPDAVGASELATNSVSNSEIIDGSVESAEILDNTILEADFNSTNTATDNYVWTFNSAAGNGTWVDPVESAQDDVGAMVSGNSEARISVTYDDGLNKMDFDVEQDLSQYDNSSSLFVITDSTTVTNAKKVTHIFQAPKADLDSHGTLPTGWLGFANDVVPYKYLYIPFTALGGDIAVANIVGSEPIPVDITITDVFVFLKSGPTGSVATFDINLDDGTPATILSTKVTIDATERSSLTAATPPVLSVTSASAGDWFEVDIDGIGSTLPGTTGTAVIQYTED